MTTSPALRASDAERERVVVELAEHATQGRLTLEELAERTERAFSAKTHAELAALIVDLPRLGRTVGWPGALRTTLAAHVITNSASVAAWLATTTPDGYGADGRSGVFWPAVPLLVSAVVLTRRLHASRRRCVAAVWRAPTSG